MFLELPLIEVIPSQDRKLVAEAFSGIATYEWIIFTSSNGAREFMRLFLYGLQRYPQFRPYADSLCWRGPQRLFLGRIAWRSN